MRNCVPVKCIWSNLPSTEFAWEINNYHHLWDANKMFVLLNNECFMQYYWLILSIWFIISVLQKVRHYSNWNFWHLTMMNAGFCDQFCDRSFGNYFRYNQLLNTSFNIRPFIKINYKQFLRQNINNRLIIVAGLIAW